MTYTPLFRPGSCITLGRNQLCGRQTRFSATARYVRTLGCRFRPEITLMHVLPPPAYGIASIEIGPLKVEEAWEDQQRVAQEVLSGFCRSAVESLSRTGPGA